MIEGVVLLAEMPPLKNRKGKCITQSKHCCSARSGRKPQRTGLFDLPHIQHDVTVSGKCGFSVACYADHLHPDFLHGFKKPVSLVGFAAIGERKNYVVFRNLAEVAVCRLSGMKVKARC